MPSIQFMVSAVAAFFSSLYSYLNQALAAVPLPVDFIPRTGEKIMGILIAVLLIIFGAIIVLIILIRRNKRKG